MAVPRLTDDLDIIQKLSDNPNDTDGLSAAELKARFDTAVNIIKAFLNSSLGSALDAIEANAAKLEGKTVSNVLGADNSTIPTSAAVRASMSSAGMGDMASATYDVNGKRTDIFDYADGAVSAHNFNADAHNDMRLLLKDLSERINAVLDSDDETLDELSEIVAYIKSNKDLLDAVTAAKVSVVDIVNNLTTNVASKPLSASQGVALKALIDAAAATANAALPAGVSGTYTINNTSDMTTYREEAFYATPYRGVSFKFFDVKAAANGLGVGTWIVLFLRGSTNYGAALALFDGGDYGRMGICRKAGSAWSDWDDIRSNSLPLILKEGVHYGESGTEPANPVEGQFYGILV